MGDVIEKSRGTTTEQFLNEVEQLATIE
jgi:hypothetical protein